MWMHRIRIFKGVPDPAADQDLDPSIMNGKKWETVNPKLFFNLIARVYVGK
jgi:hypothetical protein